MSVRLNHQFLADFALVHAALDLGHISCHVGSRRKLASTGKHVVGVLKFREVILLQAEFTLEQLAKRPIVKSLREGKKLARDLSVLFKLAVINLIGLV